MGVKCSRGVADQPTSLGMVIRNTDCLSYMFMCGKAPCMDVPQKLFPHPSWPPPSTPHVACGCSNEGSPHGHGHRYWSLLPSYTHD
jgi:hypothetical protein